MQHMPVQPNRMAPFVAQVREEPEVLFENDTDRKFALFCIKEGYSKGSITRLLKFLETININDLSFLNGSQVHAAFSKVPVTVRMFASMILQQARSHFFSFAI